VETIWKEYDRVFDVDIFEKEGVHLLRMAIERQFYGSVTAILPLYTNFLCRKGNTEEKRRIVQAARQANVKMRKVLSVILDLDSFE
jgi:hypothetical protein